MGRLIEKIKSFFNNPRNLCRLIGCNLPLKPEDRNNPEYPDGMAVWVCKRCGQWYSVEFPNAGKIYQGNWE